MNSITARSSPPLSVDFLSSLRSILGEDGFRVDEKTRLYHAKQVSHHTSLVPAVVVHPKNEQHVVDIVLLCNSHSVPIIPFGSNTSLEGHTASLMQSVVIMNVEYFDRIVALNEKDLDAVVEPGLSFMDLNRQLEKHGLWFPLDAGPNATIGGMANTNASGTKAVRYGPMRDNVLSLRVVTADGRIIKTGQRARKTSAGYDLTHLFVGSEGTLGIITQVTIRLRRRPPCTVAALCYFEQVVDAANSVMEMIQRDMIIGMVEFLDEMMVRATNLHYKDAFNLAEKPTLYFEFSAGTQLQLDEQEKIVREICTRHGGSSFVFSKTEQERQDLWRARKAALFASKELRPGAQVWTTDVCVPISRLAECIVETQKDLKKSFLPAPIVGHVGDGNFHLFILLDPKDPRDLAEANRINDNLVHRAIAMEGTCTGEHGIGVGKRSHLLEELGIDAVRLMWTLKKTLDPNGIFNPGKVLPPLPEMAKL